MLGQYSVYLVFAVGVHFFAFSVVEFYTKPNNPSNTYTFIKNRLETIHEKKSNAFIYHKTMHVEKVITEDV
jgi:hypothetical protein